MKKKELFPLIIKKNSVSLEVKKEKKCDMGRFLRNKNNNEKRENCRLI